MLLSVQIFGDNLSLYISLETEVRYIYIHIHYITDYVA